MFCSSIRPSPTPRSSPAPLGANYLALVEGLLTLLDEGGVPGSQAAWGVDVLLQVATATAAEQSTRGEDTNAEDEHNALARTLHEVSADTHPRIAALADDLVSGAAGATPALDVRHGRQRSAGHASYAHL